ncbi:MAG: patatin-like phospholipase family protein [Acidimicrobiaceae bacterium]|jgi:NTE family protein
MVSIGVVFSAGGAKGDPFHSGVIAAVAEHTGFDSRDAELIVGTSAGSFTATALRAGLSPIDAEARHLGRELSAEGNAIVDRIVTPYSEPKIERSLLPSAPRMTLNSILPPWKVDPARFAYGLLPEGTRSGASIAARIDELLPDGWPKRPTWIVAVRTNDGRRVVFGRDDITGTVGQATQASAAIPAVYTPVHIGERSYVDGALHSSTNADLVATLGFDLVIVSSVKTATPDTRSWRSDPERAWFSNKLDNELAEIRSTGTPAIVIEPDNTQLELLASGERVDACTAGRLAAERVLATNEGAGLRSIVEPAS